MRLRIRGLLLFTFLCGLINCKQSKPKASKSLLIGTWSIILDNQSNYQFSDNTTFYKMDSFAREIHQEGRLQSRVAGQYELNESKGILTVKNDTSQASWEILKLTESDLELRFKGKEEIFRFKRITK
jgi:hypothetical protein